MKTFLLALLVGGLWWASPVSAEIFKYTDDNGRTVFVDSLDKIPPRFRAKTQNLPTSTGTTNVVRSPSSYVTVEKEFETPIQLHNNHVVLPVDLEQGGRRRTFNFLLDTGAGITSLLEEHSRIFVLGQQQPTRLGGIGGVTDATSFTLNRLYVGPYEVANLRTVVFKLKDRGVPFDGILGNDVLRQLDYKIDYDRKVIRWMPGG